MKPTPEIIDLARRFHAAVKGEYGRKIQDDDLVVCIGENYPPFRVDEGNRPDVDRNAGYLVIILTESELWEWLKEEYPDDHFEFCTLCDNDNGLHESLYSCVISALEGEKP